MFLRGGKQPLIIGTTSPQALHERCSLMSDELEAVETRHVGEGFIIRAEVKKKEEE